MYELTQIIYRLFAWLRPLLWYYHHLGYFLRIAIRYLEDDACVVQLFDSPAARARFEGQLADAEHCLDLTLALRVRELLGRPMPADKLMSIGEAGGFRRIHTPASLERLAARLDRLVDRYNDIERLARLRAARLQQERDAIPVLLVPDHRPALSPSPFFQIFCRRRRFSFFKRTAASAPASLRIRAPPWVRSSGKISLSHFARPTRENAAPRP